MKCVEDVSRVSDRMLSVDLRFESYQQRVPLGSLSLINRSFGFNVIRRVIVGIKFSLRGQHGTLGGKNCCGHGRVLGDWIFYCENIVLQGNGRRRISQAETTNGGEFLVV